MRSETTPELLHRFMRELGALARGEGVVYFTGGATALLLGWRTATIDIDLRLDPEPPGAFEALRRLKNDLDVNIELASPADFLPTLPGWRERSLYIGTEGRVRFAHYDFHAQALAKIERGHAQDASDVRAMIAHGLVELAELWRLFEAIEPELIRFPAVEPDVLRAKLREWVRGG